MTKTFSVDEHHILSLFNIGETFKYKDSSYTVILSGKPTCSQGEPKTDIYISAKNAKSDILELKISFKKENANFLENKTTAERAEQILGKNWKEIISSATLSIKEKFYNRSLIYKKAFSRTDKGAITLGWKFELLNVESGQLSGTLNLSRDQVIDVYAGTNLTIDKRDAYVNGSRIPNSGVANYILFEDVPILNLQEAIDSIISIEDYVKKNPQVFFACKALNYRTFRQKYDGNRPLAVYVDWFITNEKLDYNIHFDTPLTICGDYTYARLNQALSILNAKTTDDLNSLNVKDKSKIYE